VAETVERIPLTAELIEGFAYDYLASSYDNASPTPEFHREGWRLYCSNVLQAMIVAPRGHAKSAAFTTAFILATALFRDQDYIVMVGTNEEMAVEALGELSLQLRENEDLIRDFQIKKLLVDAKTDLIVELADGHLFRIIARGSGQKMRGRKWRGRRPGLIVGDDLEDDEQVESADRREKFRKWVARALKPMLRKGGKIRVHGTVLHEDSLLSRFLKDSTWQSLFYKAHEAFDDFSNILWPEMFDEAHFRAIRQSFLEQYDAAGYSQEYLNDPFDNADAYLRRDDFIRMTADDKEKKIKKFVGCDFAVSKKDKANRTSFTVGGPDADNRLLIVDNKVGRWDTDEWMEVLFDIEAAHEPEIFFVEDGVIWKSVWPMIRREMNLRGVFMNFFPIQSIKDKATRGRALQKRTRARNVRFDKEADWYGPYEFELLRFTGISAAILDDQFDSTATLVIGVNEIPLMGEEDFLDEDEAYSRGFGPNRHADESDGRSDITGY
jgi:predicted phage terminase large subunit-like protein